MKQLLRFRHNHEQRIVIEPSFNILKGLQEELDLLSSIMKQKEIHSQDYFTVAVPASLEKVYTGTTASLFLPNGLFLCETTARLHPDDKFCRLTGRQVAQQKMINFLRTDYLQLRDEYRYDLLVRLTNNKKAQPLNW